jgi:hypothetical protein
VLAQHREYSVQAGCFIRVWTDESGKPQLLPNATLHAVSTRSSQRRVCIQGAIRASAQDSSSYLEGGCLANANAACQFMQRQCVSVRATLMRTCLSNANAYLFVQRQCAPLLLEAHASNPISYQRGECATAQVALLLCVCASLIACPLCALHVLAQYKGTCSVERDVWRVSVGVGGSMIACQWQFRSPDKLNCAHLVSLWSSCKH